MKNERRKRENNNENRAVHCDDVIVRFYSEIKIWW